MIKKNLRNMYMYVFAYVYVSWNHFAIHLKVTQRYRSILLYLLTFH